MLRLEVDKELEGEIEGDQQNIPMERCINIDIFFLLMFFNMTFLFIHLTFLNPIGV